MKEQLDYELKQIGKLIANERKKQGYNKYHFEKEHGIINTQIDYIENGSRNYNLRTLLKVLQTLNLTLKIEKK
jgi:transcriptional regulator with XRE-family HTH domain